MMGLDELKYDLIEYCDQLRKEITNSGIGEFVKPKEAYPAVLVEAHAAATKLKEILESEAFEEILP